MTAIEDLDFTVECVNCPNEARFYTQLHNCQTESGTEELVLCEEEFTKMAREAAAAIRDPRGSECPHCHLTSMSWGICSLTSGRFGCSHE